MAKLLDPRRSALRMFSIALKLARATGLTRPLRILVGPIAGKMVHGLSSSSDQPLTVHGHKMVLSAPGRYPPVAMAIGEYEQQTTSLFEQILKPGMVVIDVGAHVGYFSLIAARNVGPAGRVFSFEPDPVNFGLLQRNIELNKYANVTPINAAVADAVGPRTLFQTALDSGRHSTYHHGLPENGSVEVDTWTLDAFLETQEWPTVDLVKIDVEGAEVDVLNGMAESRERMQNTQLIIEFNPALLESAGVESFAFLQRLASSGFNVACINENQGVIPLEDLGVKNLIAGLLRNGSSVNLYCSKS